MRKKVNKNEFLEDVAKKNNIQLSVLRKCFDAIIDGLKTVVCSGKDLSLTGFGTFVLKRHKGHHVQFEAKNDKVPDYAVLKFTPSDVLITNIRKECADGTAKTADDK